MELTDTTLHKKTQIYVYSRSLILSSKHTIDTDDVKTPCGKTIFGKYIAFCLAYKAYLPLCFRTDVLFQFNNRKESFAILTQNISDKTNWKLLLE